MKQSHRIVYNIFAGYGGQGIVMIISMLLVPFLVHRVSQEGYGVFLLVSSVALVLELTRANVAKGTTIQLARYLVTKDYAGASAVMSTSMMFIGAIGLFGGTLLILFREPIVGIFRVPPELVPAFRFSLIIVAARIAISFPFMGYSGLLLALQRYDIEATRSIITGIGRAALLVFLFTTFTPSIELLVLVSLATDLFTDLWVTVVAHRLCPQVRFGFRRFEKSALAILLSFGLFIFLKQVGAVLLTQGPQWILGALMNTASVTNFYLLTMVIFFLNRMVRTMTLVLVPVASKYEALQDKDTLRALVIRGTRYSFMMVAVIVALGIPLMRPFYTIWMGSDYAFLAPYAVAIMIAGAIGIPANCAQQVLDGTGRVRLSFYATFAAALLSLPLLVFFIYNGRPLLGMTLCVVATWIVSGLAYNFIVVWLLKIPLGRFLWRSYVFPGLGLIPAIGVVAILSIVWDPQSPLALAGIGSAGALIYMGYVAATMNRSEWNLVRDIGVDFRMRVRRMRRGRPIGPRPGPP